MDGTLFGTTSLGQSRPGSNGNKRVFQIPKIFRTGALPSDGV